MRAFVRDDYHPKGMLSRLLLDDNPEEHQKRGDAAEFREIARWVAQSKR